MHAMIHIAESWATERANRFMVFLLLFAVLERRTGNQAPGLLCETEL